MKANAVIPIRRIATSMGSKAIRPFLIRMNELPHVMHRKMKMIQSLRLCDEEFNCNQNQNENQNENRNTEDVL